MLEMQLHAPRKPPSTVMSPRYTNGSADESWPLPNRPMGLQTAASALTELANLSLSSSPSTHGMSSSLTSTSFVSASAALSSPVPIKAGLNTTVKVSVKSTKAEETAQSLPSEISALDATSGSVDSKASISNGVTKNGKKRGMIFTCESCSKVSYLEFYDPPYSA